MDEEAPDAPDAPYAYVWQNVAAILGEAQPSIDRVRALVLKRYPVEQFGPAIGRGTVQRLRDGVAPPQLDTLTKVAGALGVPVWKLLHPNAGRIDTAGLPQMACKVADVVARLAPDKQLLVAMMAESYLPEPAEPPVSR